ncbi:uncharacterized protein LAESUDRAFT_384458 [Laetiporus sulphureus 93-53]|uniref:Uncharacterized protein n=1 Tax=Laetiporus sulphureus 93-53 TaxID=1314785 RepID=A0A165CMM8_9APHY|nr:uncharacterized protein LAESUDRAFT_384458 [Laetiporus sulphureus 93-53]KZT03087.1 hypothetical protein LAESUDRAFT_384458 [Laetiporus sulphureus 93-53]
MYPACMWKPSSAADVIMMTTEALKFIMLNACLISNSQQLGRRSAASTLLAGVIQLGSLLGSTSIQSSPLWNRNQEPSAAGSYALVKYSAEVAFVFRKQRDYRFAHLIFSQTFLFKTIVSYLRNESSIFACGSRLKCARVRSSRDVMIDSSRWPKHSGKRMERVS